MGYSVILDPGHQNAPNQDTGCSGFGLHEEDIVLDICKRAKSLIEANDIKVVMTRDGATVNGDGSSLNASLNTRCQIANQAKADLFLSVHCDAFNGNAYGTTCHIFGTGGNAEKFAKILNPMMGQLFYNRGIKVSNFAVLRNTNMPAVLLETAFLDNQSDNTKLADPNIRQQIAVNIAKSVCTYFGITYVENNKSTIQSSPPSSPPSSPTVLEGGKITMEHAVFYFTERDFSVARMISAKLGNCAMYCRDGVNTNIHQDIKFVKHPVFIGGAEYHDNPNTTNCCGLHDYDTAELAAEYAKTL